MPRDPLARSEAKVKKGITGYLSANDIPWHRIHGGSLMGAHKGKTWRVCLGEKGWPDLVCFPWFDGRALVIEVKGPKGELSEDQERVKKALEDRHVAYCLARDMGDVIDAIVAMAMTPVRPKRMTISPKWAGA